MADDELFYGKVVGSLPSAKKGGEVTWQVKVIQGTKHKNITMDVASKKTTLAVGKFVSFKIVERGPRNTKKAINVESWSGPEKKK